MRAPSTAVPARPQHLCALERANAVRVARAELKRRVAQGRHRRSGRGPVLSVGSGRTRCRWASCWEMSQRRSGIESSPQAARPVEHLGNEERRVDDRSPAAAARVRARSGRSAHGSVAAVGRNPPRRARTDPRSDRPLGPVAGCPAHSVSSISAVDLPRKGTSETHARPWRTDLDHLQIPKEHHGLPARQEEARSRVHRDVPVRLHRRDGDRVSQQIGCHSRAARDRIAVDGDRVRRRTRLRRALQPGRQHRRLHPRQDQVPRIPRLHTHPVHLPRHWPDCVVNAVGGKETAGATASTGKMLVAEFLFTFALAYSCWNVATAKGAGGKASTAWRSASTVVVGAISVGWISGGAFNPAIALGARRAGRLQMGPGIWIYLLADFLGGAAAAGAFLYIQGEHARAE